MKDLKRWLGRTAVLTMLAGSASACEFVNPTQVDPNAVPDARADQLFVSIQLNAWFTAEGAISRYTSMWMQQMTGTDRQFISIGQYVQTQEDADSEFNNLYTGGGLIDIKDAIGLAEERGDRVLAGIIKVHEAFLFGTAASVWGDVPFSEAATEGFTCLGGDPCPALDSQLDVYAAVQALLDEAIADLASGERGGGGDLSVDLSFGGNADAWIATAHTLKARYHMHLAETDPGRYALALTEAQQGILSASGNWLARHSSTVTENSVWFQFQRDRSGYISAGDFLIGLLQEANDPRLTRYFEPVDGEVVGTNPVEVNGDASPLSLTGAGSPSFDFPLVTCAENEFIIAEASFQMGDAAGASAAMAEGIACQEAFWGVDIPAPAGPVSLEQIITEKYKSLFLSFEPWNDYKRTCLPAIPTFEGRPMPARILYSDDEEETNPNIPPPSAQPVRNTNDPSGC